MRIALIGTYPPTHCGIASFNRALRDSFERTPYGGWTTGVVRVRGRRDRSPSADPSVVGEWVANDPLSFDRALELLTGFDVAILQHEFGIYPGPDGAAVVSMLAASPLPVISVLHTVPSRPTRGQCDVLEAILELSARIVVPSRAARDRLDAFRMLGSDRAEVIPHGAVLNVGIGTRSGERPTVLTWGLIGPGKGIEHGIEAMALLRDLPASPRYLIVGETHPEVLARQGEWYRGTLRNLVSQLRLDDRVELMGDYREGDEIRAMARAADVILLPYDSREQVCSGVLAEAICAGRPVVATGFPHAVELLATGCGLVVPHEDPGTMALAIRRVLTEPDLASAMRVRARREAERLSWPAVGSAYASLVREAVEHRLAG